MTDQPRKASDIIVALEDKVNTLLQSMSVYNLNQKLILDRVNRIYNYIAELEAQAAQTAPPPQPTDKDIVQSSAEHVITVAESPTGVRRTARSEAYTTPTPQPPIQDVQRKPEQPGSNKKVPVTQRITDGKGKDLFMAEVNIFDEQKKPVQKTKTNPNGKWQAHLTPGRYHVHIVKTNTATKEKIEAWQALDVPNADAVVTLPTAVIQKPKEA
jgi:hypothetical protein